MMNTLLELFFGIYITRSTLFKAYIQLCNTFGPSPLIFYKNWEPNWNEFCSTYTLSYLRYSRIFSELISSISLCSMDKSASDVNLFINVSWDDVGLVKYPIKTPAPRPTISKKPPAAINAPLDAAMIFFSYRFQIN